MPRTYLASVSGQGWFTDWMPAFLILLNGLFVPFTDLRLGENSKKKVGYEDLKMSESFSVYEDMKHSSDVNDI